VKHTREVVLDEELEANGTSGTTGSLNIADIAVLVAVHSHNKDARYLYYACVEATFHEQ
jgi:hypothetical protein